MACAEGDEQSAGTLYGRKTARCYALCPFALGRNLINGTRARTRGVHDGAEDNEET